MCTVACALNVSCVPCRLCQPIATYGDIIQVTITGAGAASTSTSTARRRSLLGASSSSDDSAGELDLQPLAHARATHWHPVQPGQEAVAATRRRLAATGGDDPAPAVGPARMVAWRRRLAEGTVTEITFKASGQDVVSGNQASGLLNNGDRSNGEACEQHLRYRYCCGGCLRCRRAVRPAFSVHTGQLTHKGFLSSPSRACPSPLFPPTAQLKAALAANGIDADVEVAGVTTGADVPPPAFTPPQGGGKKKGLSAGALAGIIVGSVGECAAMT